MPEQVTVDAVVIGAGAGGLAAATRLSSRGYRVLVVETEERLGGRASSREIDGFVLNTGALALERDGPVAALYRDLGLTLDLHVPYPDTVLLLGRRALPASTGPAGRIRHLLPRGLRLLTRTAPRLRPQPGESTGTWLRRLTRSTIVHGLIDNVCGAFFAASSDDLPAAVFLTFMAEGSGFKNLGFVPGGTAEVWEPLAEHVRTRGGQVWTSSTVQHLTVDDGRVVRATVDRAGVTTTVHADVFVSNIGPLHTIKLTEPGALPSAYVDDIAGRPAGGAILTVHFASPVPLVAWPGVALAARSRRMTYALNCSDPALGRVRRLGWCLYSASSTPRPATGDFDEETEKELLLADVRDHFPGFDEHAVILHWDVAAHEQPAQRAIAGFDLPVDTPARNLWNVGDGVKPWGEAGTAACLRSADIAVDHIIGNTRP